MHIVTEVAVKLGLVLEIMHIGRVIILFFQGQTAIMRQALASHRIAVLPEAASHILVDMGSVAHKRHQVVTQMVETVIPCLSRQLGHLTIDSLKILYSNTYIHISSISALAKIDIPL